MIITKIFQHRIYLLRCILACCVCVCAFMFVKFADELNKSGKIAGSLVW